MAFDFGLTQGGKKMVDIQYKYQNINVFLFSTKDCVRKKNYAILLDKLDIIYVYIHIRIYLIMIIIMIYNTYIYISFVSD